MKILIDGMGGDNAPDAVVQGAIDSLKEMDEEIVLIGNEDLLTESVEKHGYSGNRISIVHASQVIYNHEPPVKAVRSKKDSSIVKGLKMIKEGEGDVFISAGSTGALMAGGMFTLGRIQGIDRPTLAAVYPVMGKEPILLADSGANAECKPRNILEFGVMGTTYMEKVLGRENPTVGLVNNGTEEGKGTTMTKAAHELLAKSPLNFIGNIESREVPDGIADVVVTDGFTGNVIIKLTEGMGLMFLRQMKSMFTANAKTKMGAVLMKEQLKQMKKQFDYTEYGGAPILGVKGAVLKMHGSSDALAVKQTIMKSIPYVDGKVVQLIQNSVVDIEEILISE